MKWRNRINSDLFEALQVLKFGYKRERQHGYVEQILGFASQGGLHSTRQNKGPSLNKLQCICSTLCRVPAVTVCKALAKPAYEPKSSARLKKLTQSIIGDWPWLGLVQQRLGCSSSRVRAEPTATLISLTELVFHREDWSPFEAAQWKNHHMSVKIL